MKVDTSEYKLIEAKNADKLSELVTEQMRLGFRPYGEHRVFQPRGNTYYDPRYSQAMTKISSETKQELKDGIWQ